MSILTCKQLKLFDRRACCNPNMNAVRTPSCAKKQTKSEKTSPPIPGCDNLEFWNLVRLCDKKAFPKKRKRVRISNVNSVYGHSGTDIFREFCETYVYEKPVPAKELCVKKKPTLKLVKTPNVTQIPAQERKFRDFLRRVDPHSYVKCNPDAGPIVVETCHKTCKSVRISNVLPVPQRVDPICKIVSVDFHNPYGTKEHKRMPARTPITCKHMQGVLKEISLRKAALPKSEFTVQGSKLCGGDDPCPTDTDKYEPRLVSSEDGDVLKCVLKKPKVVKEPMKPSDPCSELLKKPNMQYCDILKIMRIILMGKKKC